MFSWGVFVDDPDMATSHRYNDIIAPSTRAAAYEGARRAILDDDRGAGCSYSPAYSFPLPMEVRVLEAQIVDLVDMLAEHYTYVTPSPYVTRSPRSPRYRVTVGPDGPDGMCAVYDTHDADEPCVFTGNADDCDAWCHWDGFDLDEKRKSARESSDDAPRP